ncbi:pantoate--beta-alanine ligase [Colwellia sp. 4_MG-2023]|jgi:pantoate--beta-alanine ligase|uniref:pantoate--beta-alanine ligase n=1 Tax=unclassified Colwellia TaxID=196834 RepID=UPI001C09EBA7|nr:MULTISPECIES: pantoate--beta-alanine ligase [unclassified Colwellia]MBU2925070.1 pantoate--beta-alanine ligase [Colwellia sp. C2M11]MDO6486475.1 pantoate--beta-alanine ligase [Colwellia sp. 6_MG-2023]MDO6506353.1 pantoate--beta-alanine ligase [Colwellia sp. 5_MG-2023]MDO6555177.1 pantoate--beta-alanine ligase [Colwellia sp. 4_MG-2023]MDO6651637.1 pantoate--beta-alanine ligase [Colwellia sp. 3_MG-2023]
MNTVENIKDLREQVKAWRMQGLTIAFVPTMGNLHDGHLALVKAAHKHADKVIVSIFVNPMQFGLSEDIDNYPRTLAQDKESLLKVNTDLLFTPTADVIYPKGFGENSYVEVPNISDLYCGASRPGHFRGVATVVCKLFNLVQPDVACFGSKDYQQLQVIQTMVEDLSMPVDIIPVEIIREKSGLAMSSRNGYLTPEELIIAPVLYKTLLWLSEALQAGHQARDYAVLLMQASEKLDKAGLKTDYINLCHAQTLAPASPNDKNIVILAAAYLGKARLIDNLPVKLS